MLVAWLVLSRVQHHVGRRQDARAHLAGGRAAGVGGRRPARARALARRRRAVRVRCCALALARAACIASDAMQYHSSNLAPTARYEELASIERPLRRQRARRCSRTSTNTRCMSCATSTWAGRTSSTRRPRSRALARRLRPTRATSIAPRPHALRSYPLIVTRRDPARRRRPPPTDSLWQGTYYEVWARRPGVARGASRTSHCRARLAPLRRHRARLARALARPAGARLSPPPRRALRQDPARSRASTPARLGPPARGPRDARAGRLSADASRVPARGRLGAVAAGAVHARGRASASTGARWPPIAGQLAGNSLVPDTITPLPCAVGGRASRCRSRAAASASPPATAARRCSTRSFSRPPARPRGNALPALAPARWRSLCGRRYDWVEAGARPSHRRLLLSARLAARLRPLRQSTDNALRWPQRDCTRRLSIGAPT